MLEITHVCDIRENTHLLLFSSKFLLHFMNVLIVKLNYLHFLFLVALAKLTYLRSRMAKVSKSLSRYTYPAEKSYAINQVYGILAFVSKG